MNISLKIINKIRSVQVRYGHRKFKDFLENLNFEYGD